MSAPVVHFWPGAGDPARRGARAYCGAAAVPLLASATPRAVTCKRCESCARDVFDTAPDPSCPIVISDYALWARGLLRADAPPAGAPRPAPYRNPELEDPGRDPLAALVARIRRRAEASPGPVRAALASVASELEDTIAVLRRGWDS